MLIISRVVSNIYTDNKTYKIDRAIKEGLNIVRSNKNTTGKSSFLNIIYYCLGLESILGGVGSKSLQPVYRKEIYDMDEKKSHLVNCSEFYLELSNGYDLITLYRTANNSCRDDNLITIYLSSFNNINNASKLDKYVNLADSANSAHGFHKYLEDFLKLNLPHVKDNYGNNRKLYIQLIFSSFFIEQKKGWTGILSGMPYLGITKAKPRVIEYILNLDSIENRKQLDQLRYKYNYIEDSWKIEYIKFMELCSNNNIEVINLPIKPKNRIEDIELLHDNYSLDEFISLKEKELDEIYLENEDFEKDELQILNEIEELKNSILILEEKEEEILKIRKNYLISLKNIDNSLEIILNDIQNNKDLKKLKSLGSNINSKSLDEMCPLCSNKISDSLIIEDKLGKTMSLDENISYLNNQKELLLISKSNNEYNLKMINQDLQEIQKKLERAVSFLSYLKEDLYSTNKNISKSKIYRELELKESLEKLKTFKEKSMTTIKKIKELSDEYMICQKEKEKIPKGLLSEADIDKLESVEQYLREYLNIFGFKSIELQSIKIDRERFIPISDKFDIYFDSSASDNIRVIWAYTLALIKVSIKYNGNHPGIVIFDEPAQHSIQNSHMEIFLQQLEYLGEEGLQSIVAMTMADNFENLDIKNYNQILIDSYLYV